VVEHVEVVTVNDALQEVIGEVCSLKHPTTKILIQCYGNVPKRGTSLAAGWDVNPIGVKMIAHNGWEVECRTNS